MPIDDECSSSPPADEGEKLDIIQGSNKTVKSPSVVLGKRKRTDEGDSPPLDSIIPSNKTGDSPPSVVSRKKEKNDDEGDDDSITRAIIPWELHLMYDKVLALRETVKLNKTIREVTKPVKGKNDSESESDSYGERQLKEYEDHVENLGKRFRILEQLPRDSEYHPATASPSIESDLDQNSCLSSINGSNETVQSPSVVLGKREMTDKGDGAAASKIIPWELHLMIQKALTLREIVKLNKLSREVTRAVKRKIHIESELDNYGERQLNKYEDRIRNLVKRFKNLEQLPRDWEYDPATASPSIESDLDRNSCLSSINGSNETVQSSSLFLGKRKATDVGGVLISEAEVSKLIPWELHLMIQKTFKLREIVQLKKMSREVPKAVKGKNDTESESDNCGERPLKECEYRIKNLLNRFLEQLPPYWEYRPSAASPSTESDLDQNSCLSSVNGSNETVQSSSVVLGKRKITDEGDGALKLYEIIGEVKRSACAQLTKYLEYKNDSKSESASEDKNDSQIRTLKRVSKYQNDLESERVCLDSITGSNKTVESSTVVFGKRVRTDLGVLVSDLSDDEETTHELLHTHETEEELDNAGPNWFYRDSFGEVQGPVSRNSLKSWSDAGFIAPASRNISERRNSAGFLLPDTTVWRVGQTANEAILLREMLSGKTKKTDQGDVVIDLSDDEDTTHESEEEHEDASWFYRDPFGAAIGTVSTKELKEWVYGGLIRRDTTVWRAGETPNEAIVLRDMLVRPSIVLGKRKRTDEGDGAAASNVIPMELHLMIQDALKLRARAEECRDDLEDYRESELDPENKKSSLESDYYYSNLKLERCEDQIRNLVKRFKKLKQLPRDWEYNLATASTFVAAESDISALPKMPPPEENPSKIIPLELHQLIRVALELREMLKEDDYDYLRLQLKLHEDLIKSCAKECKKLKKLSRDWKYDPTTASTFVAAKPVISALADMSPPRGEPCCCPSIKWGQKFPETKDVPLDEEEKIIWRGFKESDENQRGVSILDFNIVDKYKISLPLKEPIVSLTSKFAVTAFNEAIEMYVKKGEQNNIHDFDVVECKYLKMRGSSYYFYITIDAFEERIRGVYDTKVRLKSDDGSKSLMQFVLTDCKPRDDNKTMKLMKLKTHPGSWKDGSGIPLSGMHPRRKKKGICRGYDYRNPWGHVGP